jgi:putative GTP pyrophosphokinase
MNKNSFPDRKLLREQYEQRAETLALIAGELHSSIVQGLSVLPSPPTIKTRLKDFDSYFEKYLRILNSGPRKDEEPVITDLIGIRIVCPFREDIDTAGSVLNKLFEVVEVEKKGSKYSFKEFGYESTHILVAIPKQFIEKHGACGCDVAEIQIRTILQDAWAEVEHELVYKAEFTPFDDPMKRKLAAINANLSLADIIFQEIRTYQRQLNGEFGKRRYSFFKKVEEATDSLFFSPAGTGQAEDDRAEAPPGEFALTARADASMDDLLLKALHAHNNNQFNEAIYFYSRILAMNPDSTVRALVYKHRGMANFARSRYEEAVEDFSQSLALDAKSYKSAYYRGLVRAVQQRYSEAVEDYTLSIAINPYQHFCLYRRGQAYYHLGDFPQALADCEAALVLSPDLPSARQFLETLRNKLKM